jgi:hypothetical protein
MVVHGYNPKLLGRQRGQLKQKVSKTPSQPVSGLGGMYLSSQLHRKHKQKTTDQAKTAGGHVLTPQVCNWKTSKYCPLFLLWQKLPLCAVLAGTYTTYKCWQKPTDSTDFLDLSLVADPVCCLVFIFQHFTSVCSPLLQQRSPFIPSSLFSKLTSPACNLLFTAFNFVMLSV